jgi:hypothetical protein
LSPAFYDAGESGESATKLFFIIDFQNSGMMIILENTTSTSAIIAHKVKDKYDNVGHKA